MIHFDILSLEKELKELEEQTLSQSFWDDSKASGLVLKKINSLKNKLGRYKKIKADFDNLIEFNDIFITENEYSE